MYFLRSQNLQLGNVCTNEKRHGHIHTEGREILFTECHVFVNLSVDWWLEWWGWNGWLGSWEKILKLKRNKNFHRFQKNVVSFSRKTRCLELVLKWNFHFQNFSILNLLWRIFLISWFFFILRYFEFASNFILFYFYFFSGWKCAQGAMRFYVELC